MMEEKELPAFWAVSKHPVLQPRLVYLPGLRRSFSGFSLSAWYLGTGVDEQSHCRFRDLFCPLGTAWLVSVSNRNDSKESEKKPPNLALLCACWVSTSRDIPIVDITFGRSMECTGYLCSSPRGRGSSPAKFASPCLFVATWIRQAKC